MGNPSALLFSNAAPVTVFGKIVQFPVTRIFVVIIFLLPVTILANVFGLDPIRHLPEPWFFLLRAARDILFLALFMVMYGVYTRLVERRKPYELSLHRFLPELGIGFLVSFAMVGFMVALMAMPGYYRIESVNPVNQPAVSFITQMMVGFTEELLFRVILFKLVEEITGTWIALAVQGVLFGFAHLGNPNASIGTSVGLVLSDTLLLGGSYMLTRRIWLVMGLHWSWNFFQAGVFGMPNSGNLQPGWITPVVDGPAWITGGAWGIEASYIAIAMQFVIGVWIVRRAILAGQVVQPLWKRKTADVVAEIPESSA